MRTKSVSASIRVRAAVLALLMTAARVYALSLEVVSQNDTSRHVPNIAGADSFGPVPSGDGRFVLFSSAASHLVANFPPGKTPFHLQVYCRDRVLNITRLVSVDRQNLAGADSSCWPVSISTDGRYAVFESQADNLVDGDSNGRWDIFRRDLVNGETALVSIGAGGQTLALDSIMACATPDGRHIAFATAATNVVDGDTNQLMDVFVRDMETGRTALISDGAQWKPFGGVLPGCSAPAITPDGRYVAYFSTASNLVSGAGWSPGVYVRDLWLQTTHWASSEAGRVLLRVMGNSNAVPFCHTLSADGRYVGYAAVASPLETNCIIQRYDLQSGLTDLVHTNAFTGLGMLSENQQLDMTPDGRFLAFVAHTNTPGGPATCILVWDEVSGAITPASIELSEEISAGVTCDSPKLDSTGRYVAFGSTATNLTTNSLSGPRHLYLRDLQLGTTTLVDNGVDGTGVGAGLSSVPVVRPGGRVFFEATSPGLVHGDGNAASDVFAWDPASGAAELISASLVSMPNRAANAGVRGVPQGVSADARWLVLLSEADDLAGPDNNNCRDVFLRDLQAGTNLLVSVNLEGTGSAGGASYDAAMSADGRFVSFCSYATNLVLWDTNDAPDVFWRDVQTGETRLVSSRPGGIGSGAASADTPAMSADGQIVLFRSLATNLVSATYVSGSKNLFARLMPSGVTYALTTGGCGAAEITGDSRYIVYLGKMSTYPTAWNLYICDSAANARIYTNTTPAITNLATTADANRLALWTQSSLKILQRSPAAEWVVVTGATPPEDPVMSFSPNGDALVFDQKVRGIRQVFLYELGTSNLALVSRSCITPDGGNNQSLKPCLGGNGRFVAYESQATDIIPEDSNFASDVFLYDRLTKATLLVSCSLRGRSAGGWSRRPLFALDGQTLFFQSWAQDMGTTDYNNAPDAYRCLLVDNSEPPLLVISLLAGASGGAWLTWPADPGKSDRVQYRDSLEDLWQALPGTVVIQGGQAFQRDIVAAQNKRFYRIERTANQ